MRVHVLIAENQPQLAAAIARNLRGEGMAVDIAADWAMALALVGDTDYDVLVVDGDVPGVQLDLLRQRLQERGESGGHMVLGDRPSRAADGVSERRFAADAYLRKPFVWDELATGVRALAET